MLGLRLEHTSEPHFWPADPASPAFLCGGGAGDPVKVALLPLADPSKRIRDHHGAHMAFGVSKDEWERARDELPALLRMWFFFYPQIVNTAFEAFACHQFDTEEPDRMRAFLVADVAIECYTAEHERAESLAWLAIEVGAEQGSSVHGHGVSPQHRVPSGPSSSQHTSDSTSHTGATVCSSYLSPPSVQCLSQSKNRSTPPLLPTVSPCCCRFFSRALSGRPAASPLGPAAAPAVSGAPPKPMVVPPMAVATCAASFLAWSTSSRKRPELMSMPPCPATATVHHLRWEYVQNPLRRIH